MTNAENAQTESTPAAPEADRVRGIYEAGKLPNFNMIYFAATEPWVGSYDTPGVNVDGEVVEWSADVSAGILHALRSLSRLGALKIEDSK